LALLLITSTSLIILSLVMLGHLQKTLPLGSHVSGSLSAWA
jgi:hypothetical protein